MNDPVTRLAVLVWLTLPGRLALRFPGLRGIAGDGYFVVSAPPVAVVAPAVVTLGGFVVGAGQLGYDDVYSESILVMAVAVAIGCFSAQLGLLALAGFASGEFLIGVPSWTLAPSFLATGPLAEGVLGNLARVRLPLLITYALAGVAVVVVPRTARNIVLVVGRWRRVPAAVAWPLASGLYVTVVWFGVRMWTAAAPTLIRPRFTWLPDVSAPTADAIQPLQTGGTTLVAAAVGAAVLRQLWIGATMLPGPAARAVAAADAAVPPLPPDALERRRSTWGGAAADVGATVLATLVLAGVLEHAWLWVVTFSLLLGLRLVRSGVVVLPPVERWKAVVNRLPPVVRLVALWVVARIVTDALSNDAISSYAGVAGFVLAGVVATFVVFPGDPVRRDDDRGPGEPADDASGPSDTTGRPGAEVRP